MTDRPLRVALVGAGFIAESHLRAIRALPGVVPAAICDPSDARASRLAKAFGVPKTYRSLADMVDAVARGDEQPIDAAHVLVPPDWHGELAAESLKAGLHTFVEKPMALDSATCRELGQLAAERGLRLAVNHNMLTMPVWQRLRRELDSGRFGQVEHVQILHHVGLRQMAMKQYDHFLFQTPANILLEQGVHLFSMVEDLLGPCRRARAHVVGRGTELPGGGTFHDTWSATLVCARGTAEVFLAFGRTMPEVFAHVVGADAAARVDVLRGTYHRVGKSASLEALDHGGAAVRAGFDFIRQGFGTVATYAANLLRLANRGGDPFARSMHGAIRDFVGAVREGRDPRCNATSATHVLEMCERIAQAADVSSVRRPRTGVELPDPGPARPNEVVVTGGTGFIGSALIPELLDRDLPVTMLVRKPGSLPTEIHGDDRLRLFAGDAADRSALEKSIAGAHTVVHLATCAGADPDRADEAMASAARTLAEVCAAAGVKRLVFISSTAALYLGGQTPVTGASGPDPIPSARPVYARGKILAENELAKFSQETPSGPEVVVLRPAIVVGDGGNAQHTGVGLWPSDTHCVGWGGGEHPLPFVLVSDCASAIAGAVAAPGIGGRAFNLAGDVRWTAQRYVEELRRASGRAYKFHPQPLWWFWFVETAKWLLKCAVRKPAVYTSWRDFKSRAFQAELDCRDAKSSLGWEPVADEAEFRRAAIGVHTPATSMVPSK